ncbi:MAG: RNA pseudouridine synthase [Sphingomonadaceae bacterium]
MHSWPEGLPPLLAAGRDWLVVDKPAGLAVAPPRRGGTSLETLLAPLRPQPRAVHRLDTDTSGCLLLATRPAALRRLAAAFADGRVHKTYWAVVAPAPAAEAGVIDRPLAKRSTRARGWWIALDPAGRAARTRWQVLARAGNRALIAFQPETGRTHQLRVHATLLAPGCAIVGDTVYGRGEAGGLMLHARSLDVPEGASCVTAVAPVPARLADAGVPLPPA